MQSSAITLEPEMAAEDLATLLNTVRSARLKGPHLEIGTAAGGTLRELMNLYPSESRPRFVVIDPMTYFPDQQKTIERNLKSAGIDPSAVDFRIGYSWPLLQTTDSSSTFSFIFIDGNHGAEAVTQDLAWTRMLEPGGLVALHDFGPKFPGVVWAVTRFLRKYKNYEMIAHCGTLVVLRKNTASQGREVSDFDIRMARYMTTPLRWKRSIRKRLDRASRARKAA